MTNYITQIHVNKIFHLENFDISISNPKFPHLILTGKNGSGKTVLLNAIADFLEKVRTDISLDLLSFKKHLEFYQNQLNNATGVERNSIESSINIFKQHHENTFGKVEVKFADISETARKMQTGEFVVAFYAANRKVQMNEPRNPEKPNLPKQMNVKDSSTTEFLKFIIDLKVQAALAKNENQIEDSDKINKWFIEFEQLLGVLYSDTNLKLKFNYKDYSFIICTAGKEFKFNQLSDGYAAIIDIIADLILRMQNENSVTRAYEKEGVVLIDEIETHLHLELQKNIMPILTKVFPNIQFIITTHSPFVLNSLPNTVAFDLEKRKPITELNEYSYEALAEGYFGVSSESSYLETQLNDLESILSKEQYSQADIQTIKTKIEEFNQIPDIISPLIKGEFKQLIIKYAGKINNIL